VYSSVTPVAGPGTAVTPPKAKAAVCVPQPAKSDLAVFKVPPAAVQLVPSYASVAAEILGPPPKAKPAV